ncbi:hypothetical protein PoB_000479600 [Plakobranchus ocellatus]|uniref:Uncharacterized protein n=1 Tax=Plakobranchus ocellatus TaxID=259542 RepID=A0AAV3XSL4_9GAST|nr:hypothetical protein PoB_000479600 [Plakobranchus ocellatus]
MISSSGSAKVTVSHRTITVQNEQFIVIIFLGGKDGRGAEPLFENKTNSCCVPDPRSEALYHIANALLCNATAITTTRKHLRIVVLYALGATRVVISNLAVRLIPLHHLSWRSRSQLLVLSKVLGRTRRSLL